jgi:hypothetical protein
MPVDPNIPLGVRPVQLDNPMNALAQAQQFGLNNLKMQEAEQVMAERNALRGLNINAPDYISQVGRVNPKLALELQQGQQKAKLGQVELEGKLMANARNTLAPINDQGTYDLWRQQTSAQLPGIAQFLPAKFDEKVKTGLMLEADKYIAQTQISASQEQTNKTAIRGQDISATTARRGQDLTYSAATQPIFNEAVGGFVTRPTATNPSGTVIPLANPEATTKGQALVKGKNLVNDVATDMAASYGVLKELGGIKSKENSPQKNISAALQSSMVGQVGGSMLGTPEQDARDAIMSQRPILVQAIVKATGIAASQINSNQELKNLLDAATDPSKGYETNIKSLNKINKRFGLGGDIIELPTAPAKEKVSVGAPQKTNPTIDALLKKYE